MDLFDLNLQYKLLGGSAAKSANETETAAETVQNSTTSNVAGFLKNYEDELIELDEASELDSSGLNSGTMTIEDIESEITSKEEEITTLQARTEDFINNCQEEIERIFAEGTDVIPKEVQAQYKEELSKILDASSGNTSAMFEQSAIISENEITIKNAEKEIENKEKEIEDKEKEIENLKNSDDEDAQEQIEKLTGEIKGLNSEIKTLNYIITQSNKVIDTANKEYSDLLNTNDSLSKKQKGLMDDLMDEYYKTHTEEDRVYEDSKLKIKITGLEDFIEEATEILNKNTLKLNADIQILNQQKAQKQQELLAAAATASGGSTTQANFPITGSGYTGNLPTNNQLAQIAQNTAASQNTTGWCLRGVNDSLEKAYGFRLSYNSAYQAIPALQSRSDFTEVTNQYTSAQDLTNLPAGAIVVWENSSSHPHGHISIALGNGQEASDHIQNQTVNYGTQYHVFVKTS